MNGRITLNFGQVHDSTLQFACNRNGQPSRFAVHGDSFTAGNGGTVTFTSSTRSATAAIADWSEVLYLDPGCTGALPSGGTRIYPPAVGQAVVPGETV